VLVVAGLIANALTLAVLSRPSMHSSTNSYLSALAVCDSVVLTCSALLIGLPALPLHLISHYVHAGPYAYILSYVYPLALVAQTATVWLTVSFAVEPPHLISAATLPCELEPTWCRSLSSASSVFSIHYELSPSAPSNALGQSLITQSINQ